MRTLILLLLATAASAETTDVRYVNTSTTQTYSAIKLCNETGCLGEIPVQCAPGATCTTVAEHPHGYHVLRIEARDELLSNWSPPSNEIKRAIEREGWPLVPVSISCKADIDGNGIVQGVDFSNFLESFGQECLNPIPLAQ